MNEFSNIELKPLSHNIMLVMADRGPTPASEIALELGLGTRQVDAAITRSLVRHGLLIREARLTKVLKKAYNLIVITEKGKRYIAHVSSKETQDIV